MLFVNAPRNDFYENDYGFLWFHDGILCLKYKPIVIDGKIAAFMIQEKLRLCKGKDYPSFINGKAVKYWTLQGRKVSFNHPDTFTNLKAAAMLNSSPMGVAVVNWALRFMNPKIPMKLFSQEENALQWLQQFK